MIKLALSLIIGGVTLIAAAFGIILREHMLRGGGRHD